MKGILGVVTTLVLWWFALRLSISGVPEPEFVNGDGVKLSTIEPIPHGSPLWLERQAKAWDNPCPFLKTAYVQGVITTNEDGYTPKWQVQNAMDWAGVGHAAFPHLSYVQKWGTPGVPILWLALNRPGDTSVMHNRPKNLTDTERKKRFDELASFANSNGDFHIENFENEIAHFSKKFGPNDGPAVFGQRGEMATMLSVFGHPPGQETRNYFTGLWSDVMSVDDMAALWLRSEWPKGWHEHRRVFEWSPLSNVDLVMVARLVRFLMFGKQDNISNHTAEDMPSGFAPIIDNSSYWNLPKNLAPFDSRVGGVVKKGTSKQFPNSNIWYRDIWSTSPGLWTDAYKECGCLALGPCYLPWPFGKGYTYDPTQTKPCWCELSAAIAKVGYTYNWLTLLVPFLLALSFSSLLSYTDTAVLPALLIGSGSALLIAGAFFGLAVTFSLTYPWLGKPLLLVAGILSLNLALKFAQAKLKKD